MSIEHFLVVNLIADFALLGAVSRALGLFSWRRVLAADLLCAAYAALSAVHPAPWTSAPAPLAMLVLVSLLLTRRVAPRMLGMMALALCCAALACGGAAMMLARVGPSAMPLCVAAGTVPFALLCAAKPPRSGACQVWLRLCVDGRSARFPALIDTGNRLREPVSGLPVVIAEKALLTGVLPEDGYRVLRFGAVGGEGQMACFRPAELWIEHRGRRRPAPRAWIAVSPTPLPGVFQALAPPEFALNG